MKDKTFLVVFSLLIVIAFFCTGVGYYMYRCPYPIETLRCIYHLYAAAFLVFAFTLVYIQGTKKIPQMKHIIAGIGATLFLTLFWEVIYQTGDRYRLGQGWYIQWKQILYDLVGISIATIFWLLKRSFSLKKEKLFSSYYLKVDFTLLKQADILFFLSGLTSSECLMTCIRLRASTLASLFLMIILLPRTKYFPKF